MKPSSHTMLLVFFWFFNPHFCSYSFSFAVNSTSAHLCSYDQGLALMEFKKHFTINSNASKFFCRLSHPRTTSWHEGQDCCYWDGVTCDATTGEVIGLDLSCSWLQGQLSSNNSLFLLQHLQILNLAFNNFTGSEIPSRLSQLQSLTRLSLSWSNFSGEVPLEISYLSKLVSLDLSSLFSSDLSLTKVTMSSLVQNLTNLKELDLGNVDLSSVEPYSLRNISSSLTSLVLSGLNGIFPTSIFLLPNLQVLSLSNFIKGDLQVSLPTSNWSTFSLTELEFALINFRNGLPSSIGDLQSLKYLSIYQCVNTSIPDAIGNLTRLVDLSLSENYLVGKIPPSLAYLTNLEYLHLSNNELVGFLPNFSNLSSLHTINLYQNSLSGTIPLSLYSLPLLRYLDLSYNLFNDAQLHPFQSRTLETISLSGCGLGGPIPAILFPHGAHQLTSLNLFNNSLDGTISSSLFTLPSIFSINLGYNQLVGGIPEVNSLDGANQLTSLDFSFNSLNGTISSSLFALPSLLSLDLSYNQLGGCIPEFKSTSLEEIYLSNNKLQGNIPSSISVLANLTTLYFPSNNLSGTIDASIFSKLQSLIGMDGSNNSLSFTTNVNLNHSLPNLQIFVFSSNNLTDFPRFLRGSKVLYRLDLSNNKIYGHVPDWLSDVGRDTLSYLNLAHNSLTGIDKLSWTNLQYIDLRSNLLQGPLQLPPSALIAYFISNNSLTGDIPTLICNMSSMKAFDLSRNNFTGTIPECLVNISTLTVLDLSMNKFRGMIPTFSGHEKRSLKTLNVNGNQLEGKLSISLVNCKNLEVLDIGNNNINDTFPYWLGFITELQVLVLKSNNFHGYINDNKYQHSFKQLRIFDISNNNFVGSLPTNYIKGLEAMKQDMLVKTNNSMYMESTNFSNSYYQVSISLTVKGSEIQFEKILTTFMAIDFSKNKFGDEIPQVFGTLISLKSLNLSHNNLFGHIPSSIGNLRDLESLDFSSNKLDGTIPTELASLTFLGKLNLSQNAFVGPIPSTNNFDTQFDNSSYQENLALCGPPLSKKCGNEKTPPILREENDPDDDDFDMKIILYGFVFGLVIGLSIGYIILSRELPIWLAKMVQRYRLKKLQGRTQQSRGRTN